MDYSIGCRMPLDEWLWLNRTGIFDDVALRKFVAAFPPVELMQNVSGLTNEQDFAAHGSDIYLAISRASPKPLTEYRNLLDFGCGCGRLARMFKGHPGRVSACDVDPRHVAWVQQSLDFVSASHTSVHPPLPYREDAFDCVVSVSVFSHLTERSQDEFLKELNRICVPGTYLFISFHGQRALERTVIEPPIREMVSVDGESLNTAQQQFQSDKHAFILQRGHLTSSKTSFWRRVIGTRASNLSVIEEPFEYGISFIPEAYVRKHWGRWFEIADYWSGAIHDFQDIVVLRARTIK